MRKKQKEEYDAIQQEIAKVEADIQQQTAIIEEFIKFHKKNHNTSSHNSTILSLIDLLEKEIELNKTSRAKLLQIFNKNLNTDFSNFKDVIDFCANLANRIQIAEDENNILLIQIGKQKKVIHKYKSENAKYKASSPDQIIIKQNEPNNYHEIVDDLRTQLSDVKIENMKLRTDIENQKNLDSKSALEYDKKKQKVQKLKCEIKNLNKIVSELKSKIEELNLISSRSSQTSTESDLRKSELESTIVRLKQEIKNLKEDSEKVSQEQNEKILKKSKKYQELNEQQQALSNELFNMKLELANHKQDKEKMIHLQNSNNELAQKVSNLSSENSDLSAENRRLQLETSQISELKSKIEKQKQKNRNMNSKNNEKINQLNDTISSLSDQIEKLQKESSSTLFENGKLKEEISKCRLESTHILDQRGAEIDGYISKIKKKSTKVEKLEEELKKLTQKAAEESSKLKIAVTKLKKQYDSAIRENEQLKQKLKNNENLNDNLAEEIEKLKAEILLFSDRLKEQDIRTDKDESLNSKKLQTMTIKHNSTIKELKRLKDEMSKLKELNENTEKENESMKKSLNSENMSDDLLKSLKEENLQLKQKIKQLREEIEKVRQANSNLNDQTDENTGIKSEIRVRDNEILRLTALNRQLEGEINGCKKTTAVTKNKFRDLSSKMQGELDRSKDYQSKFLQQKAEIDRLQIKLAAKKNQIQKLKKELVKFAQREESNSQRLLDIERKYMQMASKIESRATAEMDGLIEKTRRLKDDKERFFCENQRLISQNKKLASIVTFGSHKNRFPKAELKREVIETKRLAEVSDSCSQNSYSSPLDDSYLRNRMCSLESEFDSLQSDVTLFS